MDEWPWLPPPPGTEGPDRGDPLSEILRRRLLDQRVVLLHGPLDDLAVTRVSAELMTLDADGDGSVTLRVDCGEAALAPALTLMDVIDLLGVPVRALCLGQVAAGAVGVVAVCARRSALPSTRFSLCEPTTRHEAHVRNVAQWAELQARRAAPFLRARGRRRRPVRRRRRGGPAAGALPQRGRGGRLRHRRRGVPARRRAGGGRLPAAALSRADPTRPRTPSRPRTPAAPDREPPNRRPTTEGPGLRCGHAPHRSPPAPPPRR